jgi:hypothetical protein
VVLAGVLLANAVLDAPLEVGVLVSLNVGVHRADDALRDRATADAGQGSRVDAGAELIS